MGIFSIHHVDVGFFFFSKLFSKVMITCKMDCMLCANCKHRHIMQYSNPSVHMFDKIYTILRCKYM